MRLNTSNWMTSMQSLIGNAPPSGAHRVDAAMEDIRDAMRDCLGAAAAEAYPAVELRINHANELIDLWYLRGDVLTALATIEGESPARQKLVPITNMFVGYLPKGMSSRPSPLAA